MRSQRGETFQLNSIAAGAQLKRLSLCIELAAPGDVPGIERRIQFIDRYGRAGEHRVRRQALKRLTSQSPLAKLQVSQTIHRFRDATDFDRARDFRLSIAELFTRLLVQWERDD